MPYAATNGIRLCYQRAGRGEPVLMIMGPAAAGRIWTLYQTPALNRAGYQTVVFDHRGILPSDLPAAPCSVMDMVADTAGLIEALDLAPCRIVGTSLGAMIAQELAIADPHLVRCAVLIATLARSDVARRAQAAGDLALWQSGIPLPPEYEAARAAFELLSPATLNEDATISTWLDAFELSGGGNRAGRQEVTVDADSDRREALRQVTVPCRVIAFTDDLITPPHLGAEVAEAIPDCDFVEIGGCGHLGHLERPGEVNSAIIEFLDLH